jgi:DNA recombination protein RmuC
MEYIFALIALFAGFLAAWFVAGRKISKLSEIQQEKERKLNSELALADKERSVALETLRLKNDETEQLRKEVAQILVEKNANENEKTALKVTNEHLTAKIELQKKEVEELQQKLMTEFENIANKVLKQRTDEFNTVSQKNLGDILNPLKERIQSFEKKVEDTYDKELRDKISLREEVIKLTELNTKVSQEANNLTKALKGDVKKQGNWGEIVLERVLERSGLTKGQEYEREEVVDGNDNNRQRPDVIIHLPDNKHIIIDSKVSLVAYERYMSAETEEHQLLFLREHLQSLRNHVRLLSDKNYQNAQNLNTPDFVLMFLPIEASFSTAVQADGELFSFAWERKIVIVSPTTLLATLRTIASIWKQENQTKNAQEIARLSGTLFDKFVSFIEDMSKIKANLDRTSGAYDDAMKKMKDGTGNIIRTAEKIKELGAKANKSLPQGFDS